LPLNAPPEYHQSCQQQNDTVPQPVRDMRNESQENAEEQP
jgi:hypothetical protein